MFANFEIRRGDLASARKVYGHAIGMAPSIKVFDAYIELEMQLGNIDRCRMLFERYLQWAPSNCKIWEKWADLEAQLQEFDRARMLFELAIEQPQLDMPELLWKAYIEFEIECGEYENSEVLYNRLLQKTTHVRVWLSFAEFQRSIGKIDQARDIFKRGFNVLKDPERVDERVQLIEKWREFEYKAGNDETIEFVEKNWPKRVKNRRKVYTEYGQEAGWEEYYDYLFPDTAAARPKLALLEAAMNWGNQPG